MMKQRQKEHKLSTAAKREARTAYLCLTPALCGLTFITYLLLLAVLVLSFFRWKGLTAPTFNGFDNYIRLFTTDPYFKDSVKVTIYFSILAVAGSMIYSLVVAMLLNRKIPAGGLFRGVFYMPYI